MCSTRNVDMVRSLGADHVIDYTARTSRRRGALRRHLRQLAGTLSPSACRRALTPKGTLLLSSGESSGQWIGPLVRVIKARAMSPFVGQTLVSFTVSSNRGDLESLTELVESGQVTPVVDRTYPLAEVPEAMGYLEAGHARGKVVITA